MNNKVTIELIDEIETLFPSKEEWQSNSHFRYCNGLHTISCKYTEYGAENYPLQQIIYKALSINGYSGRLNFDNCAPYEDIKKLCDTMRQLIKIKAFI